MRKELAKRDGERDTFRGTFERFGTKPGWKGSWSRTVLLVRILDRDGKQVCDHIWMNLTKALAAQDLKSGDVVEFDGRVAPYVKGYQGKRDYKLSYPTKVRKIEQGA